VALGSEGAGEEGGGEGGGVASWRSSRVGLCRTVRFNVITLKSMSRLTWLHLSKGYGNFERGWSVLCN
jgi:hypothetical protein